MMLEMSLPYKYTFVAKNLANIPPLSLINCDNTKILQEVAAMRSEMKALYISHKNMSEEIQEIKVKQVNVIPPGDSVANKPLAKNLSNIDNSREKNKSNTPTAGSVENVANLHVSMHEADKKDTDLDDTNSLDNSEASDDEYEDDYHPDLNLSNKYAALQPKSTQSRNKQRPRMFTNSKWSEYTRRQKKPDVVPEPNLVKAERTHSLSSNNWSNELRAVPNKLRSTPHQNKRCTGLFDSRLMPKTQPETLQKHIFKQTGLKLQVDKIRSKYDTYTSFHVHCERHTLNKLLNPYMWPTAAFVKQFME